MYAENTETPHTGIRLAHPHRHHKQKFLPPFSLRHGCQPDMVDTCNVVHRP